MFAEVGRLSSVACAYPTGCTGFSIRYWRHALNSVLHAATFGSGLVNPIVHAFHCTKHLFVDGIGGGGSETFPGVFVVALSLSRLNWTPADEAATVSATPTLAKTIALNALFICVVLPR